jgi:hypothetical protein
MPLLPFRFVGDWRRGRRSGHMLVDLDAGLAFKGRQNRFVGRAPRKGRDQQDDECLFHEQNPSLMLIGTARLYYLLRPNCPILVVHGRKKTALFLVKQDGVFTIIS